MEKIKLIKSTFYNEEKTKRNLCKFIMNTEVLSMGTECEKFEENFSKKQERKYSVYVANGSCANLLLIQALLNMKKINKGDKIFVSGLTWPTNIMPIIQLGLNPVLLDVEKETMNVSSEILKKAFEENPEVKAFLITNALGFCSDIDEIEKFCKEKGILFLEDNCESLGTKYNGRLLGNFGFASTFSFFVGHHLSTIEGGMICTDDKELYERLKTARAHGWTRNNSDEFKERMKKENEMNKFYDIYAFYDLAYNFRPTEINGFIGNLQINYWDEIVKKREANFREIYNATLTNDKIIKINISHLDIISNFGYPLLFKEQETCERYKEMFIEKEIEIRPIIGGNISKQPFFKKWIKTPYSLINVEEIHNKGFYFGNNPEMTPEEINRIIDIIKDD